jgi:L-alanine-DL-glutamate epimerase-like enolase superfamily enzyme
MKFTLEITPQYFPTRTAFSISRSTITHIAVIQVELSDGTYMGRGECRPYPRYDQTPESVTAELESMRTLIELGQIDDALSSLEGKSAARNALSSAWLDYRAKATDKTAAQLLDVTSPKPRETAFTLSWGSVESMITAAKQAVDYPWLKIKIGETGLEQVLAVAEARPDARLIIDANEALNSETLPSFLKKLSGLNIALIEQPLPAGHSESLPETDLIICADEGLHSIKDLDQLWQLGYRAVNVKLDKCGGPFAARDLILRAKDMGFTVMAGCMVGSSLAMAPMMTLECLCDVIDLDGALLLAKDVEHSLIYDGAIVHPPSKALWG